MPKNLHKAIEGNLNTNLEMYLKSIYTLSQEKKVARVKDISENLGVNNSSVTAALKLLAAKGLIHYDPYSFVDLTNKGETVAKEIFHKYEVLSDFLIETLSVPPVIASENACRMEHAIDNFVFERLVQFLKLLNKSKISLNLRGVPAKKIKRAPLILARAS